MKPGYFSFRIHNPIVNTRRSNSFHVIFVFPLTITLGSYFFRLSPKGGNFINMVTNPSSHNIIP